MLYSASWDVQGKSIKDIENAWSELSFAGFDFIGLQELGGQSDLAQPWDTLEANFDGIWSLYASNPPLAFRSVAVGLHNKHTPFVEKVTPLSCGIAVTLKKDSCRTFIISAHLPHKQRSDCLETWHTFNSELENLLQRRRMHDSIVLLLDTSYELGAVEFHLQPNNADERGFIMSGIVHQFGLVHTKPDTYTWSNTRGSESKIDYVLVSTPSIDLHNDTVHVDSDFLLGCDHRAVSAAFKQLCPQTKKNQRKKRALNRCGQWRVDGSRALELSEQLCEELDLKGKDLTVEDLEQISNKVSFRPKSYRFRDPSHIKDLIKQRRLLTGQEARKLGKDILRARAAAKAKWLTELLDRGSQGDYQAIAYFKKRQNTITMHSNYVARAGGAVQAVADLKRFYRLKYTPPDPPLPDSAVNLYLARVGSFVSPRISLQLKLLKYWLPVNLVDPVAMMGFPMNFSILWHILASPTTLPNFSTPISFRLKRFPPLGSPHTSPSFLKFLSPLSLPTCVQLFYLLPLLNSLQKFFSLVFALPSLLLRLISLPAFVAHKLSMAQFVFNT